MRPLKINTYISILRDYSTSPKEWVEVLYFRSKAVLGLPVLTTSYSRHAVSTIQSPISTANNGRCLIDTDGAKTPRNPVLLPYLNIIIIPRPVSISIHSISNSITHVLEHTHTHILYLASDKNSLDFYRELLSIALLSTYTH